MQLAVNKELYQLCPKASASCVSVASPVVNLTRDELDRKMRWVCSLKFLIVLPFVMLYTIMCTHTELLTDIHCAQCCHITVLSNV